jgi:hypothetical protein
MRHLQQYAKPVFGPARHGPVCHLEKPNSTLSSHKLLFCICLLHFPINTRILATAPEILTNSAEIRIVRRLLNRSEQEQFLGKLSTGKKARTASGKQPPA